MSEPFVDTNIILRLLLNDHPTHSPAARSFFARIERGEIKAQTSIAVIFEAVFILEKHYKLQRAAIAEKLLAVVELPHLHLRGKTILDDVFDYYVTDRLSFIDAYHVLLMTQLNIDTIISYDKDFDRVTGIKRVEPDPADDEEEAA